MRLVSMTAHGFRSLDHVGPIPIGRPTILAGHNDSGKTACLDALAFLLGSYHISDEDRTFERVEFVETGIDVASNEESTIDRTESANNRVGSTWVEGAFALSPAEQESLELGAEVRIRRTAPMNAQTVLEIEAVVPKDPDLRNVEGRTIPQLREIAKDRTIPLPSGPMTKQGWVDAVASYARDQPTVADWTPANAAIKAAMPRLLRFGESESADLAVKTALSSRYRIHLEDQDLKDQVQSLEGELCKRVRMDAQGLIAHIKERCPDLVVVDVDPEVSFNHGLRATRLKLARTDGEEISIGASGAGRARRISLAIWEWTSEILRNDASADGSAADWPDVVVAYDEPDTHLDYLQQRRVMRLIREQCEVPGISMIIATHSMNLIDGSAIEDIVHLNLADNRTTVKRLLGDSNHEENNRHLADIAAALGLRNTILLHERCFVGVEGPTEQQAFPILFRLTTGRTLQAAGIVVVGCNNNDGALTFAGYLAKNGRQVALIVDADSRKTKYFSNERLIRAGLDPRKHLHLIGEPDKELEYVFSDEQWANVGNELWPRNDGSQWLPEHIEALRANGKFSDNLCEMFKTESKSGPMKKTAMVYDLVCRLQRADEVPQELHTVFADLEKLAALDA